MKGKNSFPKEEKEKYKNDNKIKTENAKIPVSLPGTCRYEFYCSKHMFVRQEEKSESEERNMEEMIRNNMEFDDRVQRSNNLTKLILVYSIKAREFFTNRKKDIFTKRIGNTTYQVRVFFDENNTESLADKVMHLLNTEIAGMTAERSIYE